MDRGRLLFAYKPPAAHPIIYAGLLVFGFVWMTGSLEGLLSDAPRTIYLVYGLPWLATLWYYLAMLPSETRIHEHGIAPSRPWLLRWRRPFVAWDNLEAVYPSYYDVTGAFVSPFASSDGKVTQMGLALEAPDGSIETVRFTPSRFQMWQPESAGYTGAMEAVQAAFDGKPMVPTAESFTKEEAQALIDEAHAPFLPFFAIVLLFASAAPVIWVLTKLGLSVGWSLLISLMAPAWVSTTSFRKSVARNAILNRLSRAAAYKRQERAA